MSCNPFHTLFSHKIPLNFSITIEIFPLNLIWRQPFLLFTEKSLKEHFQVVSTQIKRPKHTPGGKVISLIAISVCVRSRWDSMGWKVERKRKISSLLLRIQSQKPIAKYSISCVHRNVCNLCVVRPPRHFQQHQRVNITSDGSQLFGDCGRSWKQHFYFDVAIKIIIKSLFWAVARARESERHWRYYFLCDFYCLLYDPPRPCVSIQIGA